MKNQISELIRNYELLEPKHFVIYTAMSYGRFDLPIKETFLLSILIQESLSSTFDEDGFFEIEIYRIIEDNGDFDLYNTFNELDRLKYIELKSNNYGVTKCRVNYTLINDTLKYYK